MFKHENIDFKASKKFFILVGLFIIALVINLSLSKLVLFVQPDLQSEINDFHQVSKEFAQAHQGTSDIEVNQELIGKAKDINRGLSTQLINYILFSQVGYNLLCFFGAAFFYRLIVYDLKQRKIDLHFRYPVSFLVAPFLLMFALPLLMESIKLNEYLGINNLMDAIEFDFKYEGIKGMLMTYALLFTQNTATYIFLFFGMAIIPAVGEELFFRGGVQRILQEGKTEPHLAIFITALIFSLFHFEFIAFFYRFFLGVLLGYTYYWSRNLLIPILIHLLNNTLTILSVRFSNQSQGIDEQMGFSSWDILVSGTAVGVILWIYYNNFKKTKA